MLGVGDIVPDFEVTGVKPKFMVHEENGVSAFEMLTQESFPEKWKVIFFYPKDFTFVCPTEIAEFAQLNEDFTNHDCVVMGGSSDNEFCKLAWRRDDPQLKELNQWSFGDTNGSLIDGMGIRDLDSGVCLRATYIIDPDNIIRHVSVNALQVGRNPAETLRILDALQTGELCACSRPMGGDTINAAQKAKEAAAA